MCGSPIAGPAAPRRPAVRALKEIFFGGTRGGGKADARSASNQHPALLQRQDCTLVAWYSSLYRVGYADALPHHDFAI